MNMSIVENSYHQLNLQDIRGLVSKASFVGLARKKYPFGRLKIMIRGFSVGELRKIDSKDFCETVKLNLNPIVHCEAEAHKLAIALNKPLVLFNEEDTCTFTVVGYIYPDSWSILRKIVFRITHIL